MTPAEQRDFLTHTRLYLSGDIRRVRGGVEDYVLKHTPTGAKLRVSAEQLFVLGQFGRGATLAEALPSLIMNRRCIPLDELYELILQARAANLLNETRDEEFPPQYPPRWWPSLDGAAAHILWWITCFGGVFSAIYWAFSDEAPAVLEKLSWGRGLLAWPVLSLCASLGGLLASAYVHRRGGDVRHPRLIWKSVLPRIGFDWSDADMSGAEGEEVVAKLRIIPFLAAFFLCTVIPAAREWAPIAVAGLLWRTGPFPGAPTPQWLAAVRRRMLLGVGRPTMFYRYRQDAPSLLLREFKVTDWGYLSIMVLWTLIWSALCCWFVGAFLFGRPAEVFPLIFDVAHSDGLTIVGTVFGTFAVMLFGMLLAGRVRKRRADTQVEESLDRVPKGGMSPEEIIEDCPLFREMPAEVRRELATLSRVVRVSHGTRLGSENGEAEVRIVAMGEVELVPPRPSGKSSVIATLERGDVFGELPFFGPLFKSANMRAVGEVSLLEISGAEPLLRRHLSIPMIEEIVQRRTFLRRIGLSSGWESISISRFSKAARFEDMKEGQIVINAGRENRFFFLVYEGAMEVRQRGRRRARILPGDFFGEISLLLNNQATADIVAEVPTRCLVLQKSEFLSLMAGDPELALRMERIASDRIGRPVFPFQGASIEALAN